MEPKIFNGVRLKNARIFSGLTLTELAERTGVSKQSISLYENNKNTPEYERVHIFAKILGFPFDYFFQKDKYTTSTETTYFRSLATATKKDRTAQSIKLEYVARMYEVLSNYVEFPTFIDPEIPFVGYDNPFDCKDLNTVHEIELAAQKIRQRWSVGDGPINDLQYMLEEHGILVTGFNTNEDKIDAFSQRTIVGGNDIYLVAVALGKRGECRIHFDMAHELGHIVLHPWSEDLETISKDEFRSRERQANIFAGALLLPKETFSQDIGKYPIDLNYYKYLKNKWKVSIQAMIFRAHQLDILTDNQYQYLMRQVSKNGWRSKEPGDIPYTLNESIFQGAIDLLFDNHILTPRTLVREFCNNGITLYAETIEELLHLRQGTLDHQEKIVPLFQLKKMKSEKEI